MVLVAWDGIDVLSVAFWLGFWMEIIGLSPNDSLKLGWFYNEKEEVS